MHVFVKGDASFNEQFCVLSTQIKISIMSSWKCNNDSKCFFVFFFENIKFKGADPVVKKRGGEGKLIR